MGPFGRFAATAVAAVLVACESAPRFENLASDTTAMAESVPAYRVPVLISDFDEVRAALPSFDLQRSADQGAQRVASITCDLTFAVDSSILSQANVKRLEPMQAYLRANPSVDVRIHGYGDGLNATDREADLSFGRAQAVARALLTDMKVANDIDAVGAKVPQQKQCMGRAEIVFIWPAAHNGQ